MTRDRPREALARAVLSLASPHYRGARGPLNSLLRGYLAWNPGLLLDPWLRYHAVLPLVRWASDGSEPLLDVGSGSVGLAFFLRHPVVSADLAFSEPDLARFQSPIRPVQASVTQLPFRDASFRGVVSIDMLEHIPKHLRQQAIRELFRVSKDLVVIGFPYGELSSRFDQRALAEETQKGVAPSWREEHVRNGLPNTETHELIMEIARRSSRPRSISWFGQEGLLGLRLRWKLQFLIPKESRFYGLVFAPLYVIHARGSPRKAYRRIYVSRARP